MTSANFFYLLAVNLPTFFTEGLHMTIVQNGLSCSMPNIGMLVMVTSGRLFDFIKHRNVMSFTNLRKLFNTFGELAFVFKVLNRVKILSGNPWVPVG